MVTSAPKDGLLEQFHHPSHHKTSGTQQTEQKTTSREQNGRSQKQELSSNMNTSRTITHNIMYTQKHKHNIHTNIICMYVLY